MIEYIKQQLILLALAPDNVIVQRSIEQAIVSLCGYRLNYHTSNEIGALWIDISTTSASKLWITVGKRSISGSWPAAYRAVRGIVGSWSFAEISNNPMLLIQAIQQLPTPAGYINLTMSFDGDKPISTTLVEL